LPERTAKSLFEGYSGTVFRYLLRMTGDRAIAEELTQDVFLRIVRAVALYEHRGRERSWVFGIARNVLLNHRRGVGRRPGHKALDEEGSAVAGTATLRVAVGQALERLPEQDREVFLLRELGGLDYAEIAELCRISRDAVRSRIYRARLTLKESLRPEKPTRNVQSARVEEVGA
jgi:RNA polymerase sigma-70 factor, ECF subfamily